LKPATHRIWIEIRVATLNPQALAEILDRLTPLGAVTFVPKLT
jgi:hypothetical protein